MAAVDHLAGAPTVKPETLGLLKRTRGTKFKSNPFKVFTAPKSDVLDFYVRGYWITRYVDQAHPGLLHDVLSQRHKPKQLHAVISQGLGLAPKRFWSTINDLVLDHYAIRAEVVD